MNRKIGPFLLSGLMIGPILGSGIILLPPLAYGQLGKTSIWAWLTMMVLGALFAIVFAKLTILHPGDGGMTNAIEQAFGKKIKLYASLLMISAVTFGPTAVMLTAAEYLNKLGLLQSIPQPFIAIVLVLVSFVVLMKDTKIISTISFVLSTLIAVTLLTASIVVLVEKGVHIAPIQSIEIQSFGKTVLLLFWAIIGWEIIGNYSSQIRDLKKTITLATGISIVVITVTYLIISLAVQSFTYTDGLSLVEVIYPVFGAASTWILALLVTGLCICTYLLIVGALARLLSTLSSEGYLPKTLSKKTKADININSILYFVIVHLIVLFVYYLDVLNIERIVNIANGFFLLNAVIGLVAAVKVIDSMFFKISSSVLSVSLLMILMFSTIDVLIALIVIFIVATLVTENQKKQSKNEKLKQII
jgi:APA family basic amino acid/polyamine antiporter